MTTITSGNTVTTAFVVSADTTGNLVLATTGGVINASSSTGGLIIPGGTTAQRPGAVNGMIRYNSNSAAFEVYANNSWATANVTPAPTVVSAPVISGSPIVGNNLTCTTGTWNNNPTGYFYQWLANSVAISANATSNVFTLTSTQNNTNITCNVTAFNAAGNSIPSTSNSLGPVVTGYFLTRSLRFRSSASAYLNRTPASAGNRQTFTLSKWIKRGTLGATSYIWGAETSGGVNGSFLYFTSSDTLQFYDYASGSFQFQLITNQVFRDPSAWYHIVVVSDTTQATAANRIKIYVNGVQITSFGTATYPSQNYNNSSINNTNAHYIGYTGSMMDGYRAEVNFIDGQALTPSSFGENNTNTGVWQPKAYTGTYGTNGFYLPFTNITSTSTLGNDSSGNGNNWTVNNISLTSGATYDSMTDVPTLTSATAANYAVMNPLLKVGTSSYAGGNLNVTVGGSSSIDQVLSSIALPSSGKWYAEFVCTTVAANYSAVSLAYVEDGINIGQSPRYSYRSDGNKFTYATSSAYGNSWTTNDIIGVAVDMDNQKIYWSKNGTWQNSGDPANGTNAAFSSISTNTCYLDLCNLVISGTAGQSAFSANFGQRPFAYTPPTGFLALNTFNLPTPTIGATASTQANKYIDATTYTGTGSSLSVTNAGGFRPDLVWIKSRSNTYNHELYDSIRGATNRLLPNLTNAESTSTLGLTSFNSNGFTQGGQTETGANGATYVGWNWQAGQGSTSTNTAGTITSTVSVNATAGFSIATYAGTGANATVGHGLGVAPQFVIVKNRTVADDWCVYSLPTGAANYSQLNLNSAFGPNSTIWNNTAPTSSVFSVGTYLSKSGSNYVAYCWTPIVGFSAIGTYTANGSTDGPFVYTGFRPEFVMAKRTDNSVTGDWIISDASRSPFNVANANLFSNLTNGDSSGLMQVDLLSNGFKLRSNAWGNQSGSPYLYLAFAESPFKYALAR